MIYSVQPLLSNSTCAVTYGGATATAPTTSDDGDSASESDIESDGGGCDGVGGGGGGTPTATGKRAAYGVDINVTPPKKTKEDCDINLRHYTTAGAGAGNTVSQQLRDAIEDLEVGRYRLTVSKYRVERAPGVSNQRLNPKCGEPLIMYADQVVCTNGDLLFLELTDGRSYKLQCKSAPIHDRLNTV